MRDTKAVLSQHGDGLAVKMHDFIMDNPNVFRDGAQFTFDQLATMLSPVLGGNLKDPQSRVQVLQRMIPSLKLLTTVKPPMFTTSQVNQGGKNVTLFTRVAPKSNTSAVAGLAAPAQKIALNPDEDKTVFRPYGRFDNPVKRGGEGTAAQVRAPEALEQDLVAAGEYFSHLADKVAQGVGSPKALMAALDDIKGLVGEYKKAGLDPTPVISTYQNLKQQFVDLTGVSI